MQDRWSQVARAGLVALLLAALVAAPEALADPRSLEIPGHHLVRGFRNLDPRYDYTVFGRTVSLLRRTFQREPVRGALPLTMPNDGAMLRANGTEPTVTWIGHA